MIDQLHNAGVIAAVKVYREGFPNRLSYQRVKDHLLQVLLPSLCSPADDIQAIRDGLEVLLGPPSFPPSCPHYEVGKTRVYFRKGVLEGLERRRAHTLAHKALVIQRSFRRNLRLRRLRRVCAVRAIQQRYRHHRREKHARLRLSQTREDKATLIQAWYRREKARRRAYAMRVAKREYRERQRQLLEQRACAAVVIQRAFRSYQRRVREWKEREEMSVLQKLSSFTVEEPEALTSVEAQVEAAEVNRLPRLATVIQSSFRGYMVRRGFLYLRHCVIKSQSVVRMWQQRKR